MSIDNLQNRNRDGSQETGYHIDNLPSLVGGIFRGAFTTPEILAIFQQFPIESLIGRSDILSRCVSAVKETATYQLDSEQFGGQLVAIFGTGGDGKDTANISTIAALGVAAAGVHVAKYGNGSASGKMGTMDTLRESGIAIELKKEEVITQIQRDRIAPVFAKCVYPGARFVTEARSLYKDQEGKPLATIFNLIMPLAVNVDANTGVVLGVAREEMLQPMAEIAHQMGMEKAIFVHGLENGLDEAVVGPTEIILLQNGTITRRVIDFANLLGISPTCLSAIQAHTRGEFVNLFKDALDSRVFSPKLQSIRQMAALNAALGMYLALGNPGGIEEELPELFNRVMDCFNDGQANTVFQQMKGESI